MTYKKIAKTIQKKFMTHTRKKIYKLPFLLLELLVAIVLIGCVINVGFLHVEDALIKKVRQTIFKIEAERHVNTALALFIEQLYTNQISFQNVANEDTELTLPFDEGSWTAKCHITRIREKKQPTDPNVCRIAVEISLIHPQFGEYPEKDPPEKKTKTKPQVKPESTFYFCVKKGTGK